MDYSWLDSSAISDEWFDFADRRQLVWRMPKMRFDELNVAEHGSYGKGSVMVWAGISFNGKTDS